MCYDDGIAKRGRGCVLIVAGSSLDELVGCERLYGGPGHGISDWIDWKVVEEEVVVIVE